MRQIDVMWDWPKPQSRLVMVVNGPWPLMSRSVPTRSSIIRLSVHWPKRRYLRLSIGSLSVYWHDKGDRTICLRPNINLQAKPGGAVIGWPMWFVDIVLWKRETNKKRRTL